MIGGLFAVSVVIAQYDPTLQYQSRGDRAEGLKTIPVGGLDVELLSVRIDTGQPEPPSGPGASRPWADTLRARFFLPESATVYLTVRQLRSRSTYYWLDYPEPADRPLALKVGVNDYGWPTQTVLQRLQNVRLEDLGAVMRVGRPGPALRERVLPVDLTDGTPALSANRYRFSLKTNGRANVTADVYSKDRKIYTRPANWEQAGSPITVLWDAQFCAGSPCLEGWYRLVLSGYFENNTPVSKEVEFYHRPRLGPTGGPR